MKYLNKNDIESIGTDWFSLIKVIEQSVLSMKENDFAQPVKPYLRYGNQKNRIIAMPGYVGGEMPLAGIKWIASFPGNIGKNLPRAHSVTILNDHATGIPLCTINTAIVSSIRTAAVSGLMIDHYKKINEKKRYTVGIVGFGPVGRMHLKMVEGILGNSIAKVLLFDLKEIDIAGIQTGLSSEITICKSWIDCYKEADIFITCTVAEKPYIDAEPKRGSLQLNVSLRDYHAETRRFMDVVIVDDWNEVCRENTDIENMYKKSLLKKEDTMSIADFICGNGLAEKGSNLVLMFNPMGMAIFDIAIGGYYFLKASHGEIGVTIPD